MKNIPTRKSTMYSQPISVIPEPIRNLKPGCSYVSMQRHNSVYPLKERKENASLFVQVIKCGRDSYSLSFKV